MMVDTLEDIAFDISTTNKTFATIEILKLYELNSYFDKDYLISCYNKYNGD